ncbi:MAG: class II aldolase, partial [Pseudomonadales bacterium]
MSTAETALSVKVQVSDEEWQTRVDLAACYRLIALYG